MNYTFTPLDLSNPATAKEEWAIFKKQWNTYLVLAEAGKITDIRIGTSKVKIAMCNTVIGKVRAFSSCFFLSLSSSQFNVVQSFYFFYFWLKN